MKAVIDGVRYDTNKAEIVGSHNTGRGWNNFRHWEATLYVTSKGCFFLAGEGGGMTEFAHTCSDNSRSAGSRVIPMNAEEALRWAEQYLDISIVEKWFTEMIQDA
jgi:hypothetical protein